MSESEKTRKLCEYLRKHKKALVLVMSGNKFGTPGIPDRFVNSAIWSGWLEFKDGNGKVTPLQRYIIGELNRWGKQTAYVVRHNDNRVALHVEGRDGELLAVCDWETLLETLRSVSANALLDV